MTTTFVRARLRERIASLVKGCDLIRESVRNTANEPGNLGHVMGYAREAIFRDTLAGILHRALVAIDREEEPATLEQIVASEEWRDVHWRPIRSTCAITNEISLCEFLARRDALDLLRALRDDPEGKA